MRSKRVGNLPFINKTVEQNVYLGIHKSNLQASAQKLDVLDNFKYHQDNDPKEGIKRKDVALIRLP